ncbi:MAG TPA: hypothetical protein VGD67_12220 [Pseudonocardiaceae bacterium]
MPNPHPPHLAEALARFRAAADSAVERGHRVAGDARAAGAAFQRDVEEVSRGRPQGRPTPPELRQEAAGYRTERGLEVPLFDEGPADDDRDGRDDRDGHEQAERQDPRRRRPPDDDDFSSFRVMHPLH